MKITLTRESLPDGKVAYALVPEDAKNLLDLLEASAFIYAQVVAGDLAFGDDDERAPHLETYLLGTFLGFVNRFLDVNDQKTIGRKMEVIEA